MINNAAILQGPPPVRMSRKFHQIFTGFATNLYSYFHHELHTPNTRSFGQSLFQVVEAQCKTQVRLLVTAADLLGPEHEVYFNEEEKRVANGVRKDILNDLIPRLPQQHANIKLIMVCFWRAAFNMAVEHQGGRRFPPIPLPLAPHSNFLAIVAPMTTAFTLNDFPVALLRECLTGVGVPNTPPNSVYYRFSYESVIQAAGLYAAPEPMPVSAITNVMLARHETFTSDDLRFVSYFGAEGKRMNFSEYSERAGRGAADVGWV